MKDLLLALNGTKIWKKNSAQRIYLNDDALIELLNIQDDEALKLRRIKSNKKTTYYDLKNDSFYSANGMIVRNAIRANIKNSVVNKI